MLAPIYVLSINLIGSRKYALCVTRAIIGVYKLLHTFALREMEKRAGEERF